MSARLAIAAFLTCLSLPSGAADGAGLRWETSLGLARRSLTEWDASGARLVRETGTIPKLMAGVSGSSAGGQALHLQLTAAGAPLDYDGQTQSGDSAQSTSRHGQWDLGLAARPLAPAAWGEVWLGLHLHRLRRDIAGIGTVGGLAETYRSVSPTLRWSLPVQAPWCVGSGACAGRIEAEWRRSVRQTVQVDFLGVYDTARFDAGRRREWLLRLMGEPAPQWRWTLEWSRMRQEASASAPLSLGGSVIGSVLQPRNGMDELSLRLGRSF